MAKSAKKTTRKVKISPYGDCWYCGGRVVEKKDTVDYRYEGRLYILENIPMGVCIQCGEKFFTAETSKKMERLVQEKTRPRKRVGVPVLAL